MQIEKINILFLILSLNVGGTEKHVLNLVSHINRIKYNPVICCLFELGELGEQYVNNEEGILVYSNLIKSKYDLSGIYRGLQIIRNENIHILYTINSPLTQLWGTILSKLAGTDAFITRVATTKPRYHAERRMIANKIMLPFVDKIIAQADTHKEYLIRFEGIKKDKIEVVYNGVELEKFHVETDILKLKESMGIGGSDPVIGIVARLAPEKGHDVLLKAAKKVVNEFSLARFLIIGDGEEKQKLQQLTSKLGIESNVSFLGVRKDIPIMLSIMDIAVLSSKQIVETVSNAILEYMAAGKPVVATNAGSTVDLVDNGKTGFLISCGDHEAMADSILKLLGDRDLASKMGKAGREKIKEKFTVQQMISKYESLFMNCLKKN